MKTWKVKQLAVAAGFFLGSTMPLSANPLSLPNLPVDQVVMLPEGSVVIEDSQKCDKKAWKKARKLAPRWVKCHGYFNHDEKHYLFLTNWLASDANPGPYQIVEVVESAFPIGDLSAVNPGYLTASLSNKGDVEIFSIATNGEYPVRKGWPYLRYRVNGTGAGARLQLIPMQMFTANTNPVALNRAELQRQKALQADATTKAEAEKREADAQRTSQPAAPVTTYSNGRGISLSHNFATNVRIACNDLPDLTEKLDRVVNEMEIYNHSSWTVRKGCGYVANKPISYQFVGWYKSEKFLTSIVLLRFEDGRRMWRPIEVIKHRFFRNSPCLNRYIQETRRGKTISIHGVTQQGVIPECSREYPFIGAL